MSIHQQSSVRLSRAIQYQQPFTFLPGPDWLKSVGTILNCTNVEIEVSYGTADPPLIRPLNGSSEESGNFTLYFDNNVFSARVPIARRKAFQRNAASRAGNDLDFTEEATCVNFSSNYRIREHFKVFLQPLNLTDEYRTKLIDSVAESLENRLCTGTQYYVDVQYCY